ncbi:acetyl-CoA carboxylase biotin carboxylase subunit [Ramlibacter tataouinensis]|uniref:acetyl-CoA carboxylase biotin carboxylase subunit n=1 Tax=Ramlibacter tataouinensis TaxID=94132 RepID=UPI0022F3F62E|nr:acetyl-CoA carboxylase biotin carboxylase subunit [Ramlibacter tataouinensis]WBY02339.1 acetyl-CoA carboxylase biotin carboxylase subunit [Ramlibacter tataouinensis]
MTTATPFHKILVANRGEIALRIMRTAHRLGYRTVGVYSSADADSPHVAAADQAVCIGEPAPAQSYLNVDALLAAARAAGADAVHPGYGFLAENEGFAQACRDAGLVFIGPSPESIRAMGDKAAAKRRMAEAGLPCIPGYDGSAQDEQRLLQEAQRIGWPVMIKATAGGGGRGMRLARSAGEFPDLLRSAQSEASHAFGDGTVLLERAIESPRHVEIQVFADRHGQVVHLGERDCSVQRRHQKLVEEAPSPAVDAALRERMGAAAVAAMRAIGYEGAGTLEFLLDADGRFWFMEMNTRLQVEHPVTEALTGLDLVEWQLRVAAGEPLPLRQEQIRFDGHAIEVRLCAEDPAQGFLPQSGTLLRWQPPAGLRVEHALASGCAIPPWYDSMVAKLVAHGATREQARRRLLRGLDELVALGVPTNQALLARCLQHPAFAAGQATTAFIAQHEAQLLGDGASPAAKAVAAWLLVADPQRPAHPLAPALALPLRFDLGGETVLAQVARTAPGCFAVRIGDEAHSLQVAALDVGQAHVLVDGVQAQMPFVRQGDGLWFLFAGQPLHAVDRTRQPLRRGAGAASDGRVRASMNGRVVAVLVEPGQAVQAGQPLLALEAMKMEHVHAAPVDGTVEAVLAAVGEQVPAGHLLAQVAPAAANGSPA